MPAENDILTINIKLPLTDDEATEEGALLILKEIKPSWKLELITFKVSTYLQSFEFLNKFLKVYLNNIISYKYKFRLLRLE